MSRNFLRRYGRRAPLLLLAATFLAAAWWSLRLARADWEFRRGTEEGARRAAALAPGDARYQAGRSDWGSAERRRDLEKAVALNPYYAEAWIELGLMAEARRDFAGAERYLLEAARVDRGFGPRWTLANFYFRRQDPEKFWEWARRALEMRPSDPAPLYRLCWLLEPDGEKILSRAIPPSGEQLAHYVRFLMRERRLEEAARAGQKLLDSGGRPPRALLVDLCEQLVTGGQVEAAVRLWNRLIDQKLLALERLDPGRGPWLANPGLAAPLGRAFDWRLFPVDGVLADPDAGGGLRIRLSGRQGESCELLAVYAPVRPSACYRLEYRYATDGLPPESGLRWRIADPFQHKEVAAAPAYLWRQAEGADSFPWCAPPGTRLVKLALRYDRAPGTTPAEGRLVLRGVRVEAAIQK
jgi:hypothetical protein